MSVGGKDNYASVNIVCGVVLQQNDKYLLIQEGRKDIRGKWNIPAGKVDQGESLEEAAVRETKEESGYDVRIKKHLLTLHQSTDRDVLHAYSGEIVGCELSYPEDELLDARWFTREELESLDLRNPDYILGALDAAGD